MISRQLSNHVGIFFGLIYSIAVVFFLYHLFLSQFELVQSERIRQMQSLELAHAAGSGFQVQELSFQQAKETITSIDFTEVLEDNSSYSVESQQVNGEYVFGNLRKMNGQIYWLYQTHKGLLNEVFYRFIKTSGLYLGGMVLLGFGMLFLIHRYSISHVNQIIAEEEERDRKSHFDPLTHLKNRVQFLRDLNSMIESATDPKDKFALVIFDVDNLSDVNTEFGHDRGDKVLKYLSMRVRNTLNKRDEFARTGGDEFMILVKVFKGYQQASRVVDRVLNVVSQSTFNIDHESIQLSLSAGLAFFPQDGKDAETIIESATQAMTISKNEGKGCFRTFDPKINRLVQEKVQVEHRLKQALSKSEFRLVYQGVHDQDSTLVGAEALIRWNLDGEILEPHKFLPLAQNGQLMISIGYWVIEEVMRQMSEWRQEGFELIPIHINLTGNQIQDEHLVSIFEVLSQKFKIPLNMIRLDIKEVDLYDRRLISQKAMVRLAKLGLKIWIDDMGTGYSSFNSLANIPFEGVKVDGFLTSDLLIEERARATIESLIQFAQIRGWKLIAESVETQEQANWYMNQTDALFQGMLFSKVIFPNEFADTYLNKVR